MRNESTDLVLHEELKKKIVAIKPFFSLRKMKIMRAAAAAAAEVKFRIGGRQRDWDHPGAVLQLKLEVLNFLFLEKKSWLGLIEAQVFGLIIIITVKHLRYEWYRLECSQVKHRTRTKINYKLSF